jgi:hypothetical protein
MLLVGLALAGCSATPIPGAFTPEELRQRCERDGGWWKTHDNPPRCELRVGEQGGHPAPPRG